METTCRRLVFGAILASASLIGTEAAYASAPIPVEEEKSNFAVTRFGAKGNGTEKDTAAIQAAIDACSKAGGGTVFLPAGTFLSGSLHLRSHVALHLDHGAVLKASKDAGDFDPLEKLDFKNAADRETSFFHHALIWGEDVDHIAITGSGTIDGNRTKRGGPKQIALKRCQHVQIKDVTIVDSPNYCISLLGTDYVYIDGVTILNGFADGIDPDCCHHVRISNCHIESWDDAICPKTSFSLGSRRSVENLTVVNCVLATNCNAFKLGTESGGDFKNITVTNCAMYARPVKSAPISGISLLSVDGSNIDGVAISNISMKGVSWPIFLRLGNRGRDMEKPVPGSLKNVVFSNIVATDARAACALLGLPDHPIEGVSIENLRLTFQGGGKKEATAIDVPEFPAKYPSADNFGVFPAYGIYCRHVRDLRLAGIRVGAAAPDLRHAVVCDDVTDLVLDSVESRQFSGGATVFHLREVRDCMLRGSAPKAGEDSFVRVSGPRSAAISLIGNDFSRLKKPLELAPEVAESKVRIVGN